MILRLMFFFDRNLNLLLRFFECFHECINSNASKFNIFFIEFIAGDGISDGKCELLLSLDINLDIILFVFEGIDGFGSLHILNIKLSKNYIDRISL